VAASVASSLFALHLLVVEVSAPYPIAKSCRVTRLCLAMQVAIGIHAVQRPSLGQSSENPVLEPSSKPLCLPSPAARYIAVA